MFDETQSKIIQATMDVVMERGYASTTTKDIASRAGINECTIFRKFDGKKNIVLAAMELPEWNPCLTEEDFQTTLAQCRAATMETLRGEKWTRKLAGFLLKAVAPLL